MSEKSKSNTNKKTIIGLILILIVLGSGCTSTQTIPVFINNTNSTIDNFKACYEEGKKACNNYLGCVSFHIDEIECDDDVCICL